jgi:hypothetical protein
MQNKANFRNEQMNISSFITSKYEHLDIWCIGKNKAKTKPNKANSPGFARKPEALKPKSYDKFEGSNVQMTKMDSLYHSVPLCLSVFVAMS